MIAPRSDYPRSFESIQEWARSRSMPVIEARQRFAQFGVLVAIARSRALRPILVLKGGNALDFVWQANRSTRDLDFSVSGGELDEVLLQARLKPALDAVERELGISRQKRFRVPVSISSTRVGCSCEVRIR